MLINRLWTDCGNSSKNKFAYRPFPQTLPKFEELIAPLKLKRLWSSREPRKAINWGVQLSICHTNSSGMQWRQLASSAGFNYSTGIQGGEFYCWTCIKTHSPLRGFLQALSVLLSLSSYHEHCDNLGESSITPPRKLCFPSVLQQSWFQQAQPNVG